MKNVIRLLLLCTCLLLVDAGIIYNHDTDKAGVQEDRSGSVPQQPSSAAQPQAEKSADLGKPPCGRECESVAELTVKDEDSDSDDTPLTTRGNLHSEDVPEDEANDDSTPPLESQINGEPPYSIPVFEDVDYDDYADESETGSSKQFYNPLLSPTYTIPNSYLFNSQPQTQLYKSLIEEIRYRMEAVVRRQDLIVKYIKCSCLNAKKCRKLHMDKYKPLSLKWHDSNSKQFQIPGFGSSNYFNQQLPGASYADFVLTSLTTLKSAVEKVTLRQSVLYQYILCSCTKNECSEKIKPALDALFSLDSNLLSPLTSLGGSTLSQLGSGLGSISQNFFGSSGEDLTFNKPNITSFGNGSTSGAVYSGTIGESSHPSGNYFGTYVSSSSNDKHPSSGASSGIQTSCLGDASCETSGSVSLQIDGNKPEDVQLSFTKPHEGNVTTTVSHKPLGTLIQAIAELGNVASNISSSLGESKPESEVGSSSLVASLTETSQLANQLLNKLTSGLLGSTSKPQRSSSDYTTS